VATHLDRALVQAHPAIFLLALMDPDLVEPTRELGKAIQAYAAPARSEPGAPRARSLRSRSMAWASWSERLSKLAGHTCCLVAANRCQNRLLRRLR
jgi:hypothetical protein